MPKPKKTHVRKREKEICESEKGEKKKEETNKKVYY